MLKKTLVIFSFLAIQGYACDAGIATTTTYYLPSAKVLCGSEAKCEKFKKAVNVQGSGFISPGVIYTHTGKTISYSDCNTTKTSSSGKCLMPYISVAAGKPTPMGTIIEMPGLRGVEMKLKDGRKFYHPGYLIVHDRGGAIKGAGRFDIFTDDMIDTDPVNSMGKHSPSNHLMSDKAVCADYKKYKMIPINPNADLDGQSDKYKKAYKAISDMQYLIAKSNSKSNSSKSQGVRQ